MDDVLTEMLRWFFVIKKKTEMSLQLLSCPLLQDSEIASQELHL